MAKMTLEMAKSAVGASNNGGDKHQQTLVEIPKLNKGLIHVRIIGDSPLITHAWSEKAIKMIEDKQGKRATAGRAVRDPKGEYEASMYRTPDGSPGIKALAIKDAAVTACTSISDIKKTTARQCFFIKGDILPIIGKPHMRTDMVRVGMGAADVRYRAEFDPWAVEF